MKLSHLRAQLSKTLHQDHEVGGKRGKRVMKMLKGQSVTTAKKSTRLTVRAQSINNVHFDSTDH
jgi:hypothetical protein